MVKKKQKNTPITRWDNLRMAWDTPPEDVRLVTDAAAMNVSWPFGDDLAEVFETLDDRTFEVYLEKAWHLCRLQAHRMSPEVRDAFLVKQRRRLDGYRAARERKPH